jgi:hypothetical protein
MGEMSKSAQIWNRSRSLRTMDMLNSRLPAYIGGNAKLGR